MNQSGKPSISRVKKNTRIGTINCWIKGYRQRKIMLLIRLRKTVSQPEIVRKKGMKKIMRKKKEPTIFIDSHERRNRNKIQNAISATSLVAIHNPWAARHSAYGWLPDCSRCGWYAVYQPVFNCGSTSCSAPAICPVSYTHLDVYKRQLLSYMYRK